MKQEGDSGDGIMTEAEMAYLASMEEVKNISKQLVVAEKAFHLVRDRIEKLVAKYEALLVKLDTESVATESVITYESSYYSDDEYESGYSSEEEREWEMFQRRAQRAELRAELAVREAAMAKQEAQKIKEEKQREIETLQQKLAELQSESSLAITEREHSVVLARRIYPKKSLDGMSSHSASSAPRISEGKINDVKQKFRDRMAEKMSKRPPVAASDSGSSIALSFSPSYDQDIRRNRANERPPLTKQFRHRLVGEETFQHLDFYERSLKAIDDSRGNKTS